MGDRFQVREALRQAGKKLSLQKHHHRSEHWIVVRGTAEVTVDGQVTMLTENSPSTCPSAAPTALPILARSNSN